MHLSPYSLHCSVCQTEIWSKCHWLQHLSTEKHQRVARELCVREWGSADVAGVKMRKRCLLIFSSFPVSHSSGGALKIIQHFSKKPGLFVTDFVCWEERPCLAVVQFESAKIAKDVFSGVADSEVMIDSQPVQIKLGRDLRHLEWSALFPMYLSSENVRLSRKRPLEQEEGVSSTPTSNESGPPVVKKVKMTIPANFIVGKIRGLHEPVDKLNLFVARQGWPPPQYCFQKISGSGTKGWSCTVTINGVIYSTHFVDNSVYHNQIKCRARRATALFCLRRLEKEYSGTDGSTQISRPENGEPPFTSPPSPTSKITPNPGDISMLEQFRQMLLTVTVPDSSYNTVLQITENLRTLFGTSDPSVVVVPIRNLHLKLTNPNWESASQPLFFVYSSRSPPEFPNSFTWLGDRFPKQLILSPPGQQHFSVVRLQEGTALPQESLGVTYCYKKERINFVLATAKRLIVEAQVCRLLEYMVTFDSRCHSLMALTFYWAKVNHISFGELAVNYATRNVNLPEPLTLEWLVVHFLCHKGYIPSVRKIQARPHKVLREGFAGMDVGFKSDTEFVQEWRSNQKLANPGLPTEEDPTSREFVLSVLKLFQDFLQFYGNMGGDNHYILNTRDGEVINVADFLGGDPGPSSWTTSMTSTDLFGLRVFQRKREGTVPRQEDVPEESKAIIENYKAEKYRVNFMDWNLYMVHPFFFTWRFSLTRQLPFVLQLMEHSSKQLKSVLEGGTEAEGVSLETVLTVDWATREAL